MLAGLDAGPRLAPDLSIPARVIQPTTAPSARSLIYVKSGGGTNRSLGPEAAALGAWIRQQFALWSDALRGAPGGVHGDQAERHDQDLGWHVDLPPQSVGHARE